jgi:rubredoxin
MAGDRPMAWTVRLPEGSYVMVIEMWRCPRCKVVQRLDGVKAVEIVEPGKNPRTEYHGKIRPHRIGNAVEYICLVCGHVWGAPPEDPTPGGASVTFLHPVNESDPECDGTCVDRDCC